jgi:hypothetical protein
MKLVTITKGFIKQNLCLSQAFPLSRRIFLQKKRSAPSHNPQGKARLPPPRAKAIGEQATFCQKRGYPKASMAK